LGDKYFVAEIHRAAVASRSEKDFRDASVLCASIELISTFTPMMTAELPTDSTVTSWDEELINMEIRVARRADELARGVDFSRSPGLLIWFKRREILGTTVPRGPVSLRRRGETLA